MEQGKLNLFPQLTETREKWKQSLTLIDIYRKCRASFLESDTGKDLGLYMIECKVCKECFRKKRERVPDIYLKIAKKCGSILYRFF